MAAEIERYLRTGGTDPHCAAWDGDTFLQAAQRARHDLRAALIAEVLRRSEGIAIPGLPTTAEAVALTRRKTEPMVRGLFPRAEHDAVLGLVERSVVFLGPANIGDVLREESFPRSAWVLANLYLGSIGADLLGSEAPDIVGLSREATCFVSPAYFDDDDPFADFVVHEVAHVFHNCKRQTAGLPFTRRREWMLDIDFRKRETFAYACEAFARIVQRARRATERIGFAREFGERFDTADERVESSEVVDIVLEAATVRNGWKAILRRCAPHAS